MDVLMRFGFSIEDIKMMMDSNEEIDSIQDKNINGIIDVLREVGCTDEEIKNIFLCNPFCLSIDYSQISNLIQKLESIGCNCLFLLLDSNPYLLNRSTDQIDEFYQKKIKEGFSEEEIINDINYHMI